jgi:hypothetical protein
MDLLIHFFISGFRGMHMKNKSIYGTILIGCITLLISLYCFIKPSTEFSVSERRKLSQMPEWSVNHFLNSGFNDKFEKYVMDQLPFREDFRRLKSILHYYIFQQKDNHGIYFIEDYAAKLEYPYNQNSVNFALDKFEWIYKNYMIGKNLSIYSAVVPDKSYFLAKKNGYPAMDYEALFREFEEGMSYAQYINLTSCLSITDYYHTDTHWKQENLIPIAERIKKAMGLNTKKVEYHKLATKVPFYGVYYGQSALPLDSDTLHIMTNDIIDQCTVYNYETNKTSTIYDMDKLNSDDPYEVFLSGATPIIQIINPNATTNKELILFRDSFGSSLAPLIVDSYKTITLVDIRYIKSELLDEYITLKNQDVLFLYSTLVLNNCYSLK